MINSHNGGLVVILAKYETKKETPTVIRFTIETFDACLDRLDLIIVSCAINLEFLEFVDSNLTLN